MSVHLTELLSSAPPYPRRVVCMTEETTEVLYRIGAGDLVVGVSGFTVRPPEARKKPRVSSFLDANFERILELKPDLVLGFSDLQADLGRELCKRGVPVYLFNQRSLAEILQTVRVTGALVGRAEAAEKLAAELTANLERHAEAAQTLPRVARVAGRQGPHLRAGGGRPAQPGGRHRQLVWPQGEAGQDCRAAGLVPGAGGAG